MSAPLRVYSVDQRQVGHSSIATPSRSFVILARDEEEAEVMAAHVAGDARCRIPASEARHVLGAPRPGESKYERYGGKVWFRTSVPSSSAMGTREDWRLVERAEAIADSINNPDGGTA